MRGRILGQEKLTSTEGSRASSGMFLPVILDSIFRVDRAFVEHEWSTCKRNLESARQAAYERKVTHTLQMAEEEIQIALFMKMGEHPTTTNAKKRIQQKRKLDFPLRKEEPALQ